MQGTDTVCICTCPHLPISTLVVSTVHDEQSKYTFCHNLKHRKIYDDDDLFSAVCRLEMYRNEWLKQKPVPSDEVILNHKQRTAYS